MFGFDGLDALLVQVFFVIFCCSLDLEFVFNVLPRMKEKYVNSVLSYQNFGVGCIQKGCGFTTFYFGILVTFNDYIIWLLDSTFVKFRRNNNFDLIIRCPIQVILLLYE